MQEGQCWSALPLLWSMGGSCATRGSHQHCASEQLCAATHGTLRGISLHIKQDSELPVTKVCQEKL